jgi:hypothetical protein
MNSETVELPAIGEMLLTHGCTQRQMQAVDHLLGSVERYVASVNLSVIGIRQLAHCGKLSEKDADAVLWLFKELLSGIRGQRDSIAGLVGRRVER